MSERPNVVFIFADQMRAEAMGCMGNDQVQTPNMDRLAGEGLLFPNAYTSNPVCGPARSCILTGRYAHANGLIDNRLQLPPSERSLGNCLRDAGYDTGYVGKWHLDSQKELGTPGHVPPGPRRQGFEYWKGFNNGHDHMRGHPHFDEEGNVRWEEGYQPEIQTDLALEFIDDRQEGSFGLVMSWGPPHGPREAPQRYHDMYDPEELDLRPNVPEEPNEEFERRPNRTPDEVQEDLADYYASITALDDQLGRVIDRLDELGIAEETILVFTADHGDMLGSQGRYGKDIPHEESIHIPLVLRYPDQVEAGRTSDAFIGLVDYMPTLLSLADVPIPDAVQGRDLSDHVLGRESETPDGHFIEGNLARDHPFRALRTERYLITVDYDLDVRHLFDMESDPYQLNNLADDDSAADVREELYERLIKAIYHYDDRYFMVRDILPEYGLTYGPPGFGGEEGD